MRGMCTAGAGVQAVLGLVSKGVFKPICGAEEVQEAGLQLLRPRRAEYAAFLHVLPGRARSLRLLAPAEGGVEGQLGGELRLRISVHDQGGNRWGPRRSSLLLLLSAVLIVTLWRMTCAHWKRAPHCQDIRGHPRVPVRLLLPAVRHVA
jgi:hypothetical protein